MIQSLEHSFTFCFTRFKYKFPKITSLTGGRECICACGGVCGVVWALVVFSS